MTRTIVVPAEMRHAELLAQTMRQADRLELEAVGFAPAPALRESIEASDPDMVWACLDIRDNHPIALFGVAPLVPGIQFWGAAWLLTSERFTQHPREVWQHSMRHVAIMHTRYAALTNWIDERNTVSLRWLKRLGFTPTVRNDRYGVQQLPFIQYVSLRNV